MERNCDIGEPARAKSTEFFAIKSYASEQTSMLPAATFHEWRALKRYHSSFSNFVRTFSISDTGKFSPDCTRRCKSSLAGR